MAVIKDASQVFAASDRKYEIVPCPEWGGDIVIQALSGKERDEFEGESIRFRMSSRTASAQVVFANMRARLVCLSARVEPDGARLFEHDQVEMLGEKNGAVLDRLYSVAARLSGLTGDDVKELAGNFQLDLSAVSTST